MTKAIFRIEENGKTKTRTIVIPEKLAALSEITDTLTNHDFDDVDMERSPFHVCYDYLADKCVVIAANLFKVNPDKYVAIFTQLSEEEEDKEIAFSVSLEEV
jgi:hypothetical protein